MSTAREFRFLYRTRGHLMQTTVAAESFPEACYVLGIQHAKGFLKSGIPKDFEINIAEGRCFVCGCTEEDCRHCIEKTGQPCSWANEERTICTACAEQGLTIALGR